MKQYITTNRTERRKRRVSTNIRGTDVCPRISVFRSSKYIYAQAIDDVKRVTLCISGSKKVQKAKKTEQAFEVGKELGAKLKEKNIQKAVYDRGSYTYLGRVQKLAEGLREAGIKI